MFEFMRMLVGADARPADSEVIPKIHEVAPRDRPGTLVQMLVYYHGDEGQLEPGDIGFITGSDGGGVLAKFTSSSCMFTLQRQQFTKAPSPCRCVGDTVYSCIDHSPYFKKGSKGTIEGISTDKKARDRVAVKFGISPQLFNMLPGMLSAAPPAPPKAPDAPAPKAPSRSAFGFSGLDNALESLRTEDVSLISHAHGRERRAERNILRRELQAAIKHGVKEKGNPGRDGSPRWRYTYDGVVYITDETSRHEVTSWRVDGVDAADAVAPAEIELAGKGAHAVLVVDSSGSMRTADVPGFESRAQAVYDCLVRDFAAPQVKTGAASDVVVSLISMGDNATVLLKTQPLDETLIANLERIGKRRPKSHGNYIPALDKALEVMAADAANRASVLLLFFSDGAPSDTSKMECEHGLAVFDFNHKEDPKMGHRSAGSAWSCRKNLHAKVKSECLDRIKRIGQIFGRDKVILRTLAFGPPKEDFTLLNQMADALPRGEFQKLGLNAGSLRTAFSSLSSSMSELRTENGGSALTPRRDKVVDKQQKVEIGSTMVHGSKGWWIYAFEHVLAKLTVNASGELRQHLKKEAEGIAFIEQPFANGVERFVYHCTEVVIPMNKKDVWYYEGIHDGDMHSMIAYRKGLRLVAKEAKDVENLHKGRSFHEVFARVQQDAAALAMQFNRRQPNPRADWNVSYLPTTLYCVKVPWSDMNPSGKSWILVEPELEGKFTKWNDNGGGVRGPPPTGGGIGSMALLEEEDEEDEEASCATIDVNEVPQAFSHFSYECSKGKQLVCDLQGVWNPDDGFVLTDPVVHYVSSRGKRHLNGATDKGLEGVKRFFGTHKCNALCAKMKLPARTADTLIAVVSG